MNRQSVTALIVLAIVVGALYLLTRPRSERDDQPVVGVILAITGSADFIGKPERDVLEKLEEQYRSLRGVAPAFRLEIRDSGGKRSKAEALFRQFAQNDSCVAVIGPSTSGESIPIAELAEARQVPLLSLAASAKIVESSSGGPNGPAKHWVFKFAQNDSLAASRLLRTMTGAGHDTVALLFANDGFGKSGAAAFEREVAEAPTVEIVHKASFPSKLERPEPVVNGIPSGVKAVLIWGTSPGPALLAKELARVRHKAQKYFSHGNASHQFIDDAGPASEGAILVGSRVLLLSSDLDPSLPGDRVIRDYQQFWSSNFTGAPSHFGGHARDAFALLMEIAKTTPTLTRQSVRTALEETKNWPGVTGTFSFSAAGHAGLKESAFATYRVQGGMFKTIKE